MEGTASAFSCGVKEHLRGALPVGWSCAAPGGGGRSGERGRLALQAIIDGNGALAKVAYYCTLPVTGRPHEGGTAPALQGPSVAMTLLNGKTHTVKI